MPTTMSRIHDERLAGGLAVLVALAGMAVANFNAADGESGGPLEFAVSAVILIAVAAVVFGRLVPATTTPGRLATWLLVGAIVTIPVFWLGLPVVLGAAAAVAGARAASTGGAVTAALGALIAVACVAALVLG